MFKPSKLDRSELVLTVLQTVPHPLSLEEIGQKLGKYHVSLTPEEIETLIEDLSDSGFDIKEITEGQIKRYVLVKYFDTSGTEFRPMGEVDLPLLLTGDFHYGSVGFMKDIYEIMLKDIERHGVKHITIAGDLIQGRGVFRTEFQELAIPAIGEQISGIVELLEKIPENVKIHLVLGNHEEKAKGSIEFGMDPLKIVSKMLPNCTYYGHIGTLSLKDWKFMFLHGSGVPTIASSFMVEKIWRGLVEKPRILQVGHNHQMNLVVRENNSLLINSGTLQRTNAWLMSKGFAAKIGWYILKDYREDGFEIIARLPREM
jgi:Icc-related predicted phosphoesterase/biotin operon repressor